MGTEEVKGLGDIQRFYVVMNPDEDSKFCEMIVGQKKLPDVGEKRLKPVEKGKWD